MAKNKVKKNNKKKASKPVQKAKKAASKPNKKAAKVVKKDKKPAKKANSKVITTSKNNSKPGAKAKPVAKNNKPVKKGATPAKPSKPETKPVQVKVTAPRAKARKVVDDSEPKAERMQRYAKTKEKPVLSPELAALPKLPANIHYKRGKGRLAPGEKRLVKTDVITHHVISDKPIEAESAKKAEPNGKYSMEFLIRCPVTLLYDFLSTPSGLQEWFADDVTLKDDIYTFNWDGQLQKAKLLNAKIDSYLRFHWIDKPDGTYVEFRVTQDELTGEVALTVTDFGDSEEDITMNKRLWNTQIQRLIKVMGAY